MFLQTEIPTFVNAKVCQLTDLMYPLSVPDIVIPILIRPYLSDDIPVTISVPRYQSYSKKQWILFVLASLLKRICCFCVSLEQTNKQDLPID